MKEVRIHARAGQGAITVAALLGDAVFEGGRYAYVFPSFGAARMGAPMNAFVRIDEKPIRLRSQVKEPDYLIIIDPTIMQGFDVFSGLKENGIVVVNSSQSIAPLSRDCEKPALLSKLPKGVKIYNVPGNEIAQEILGRPLGNTVTLGAFAKVTGEITLESLNKAVRRRFSEKIAEKNIEMIKRGYEFIKSK